MRVNRKKHALIKMNIISSVFALVSDRSSPNQSTVGNLRLSKVAETGTEMSRQEVTVKLLSTLLGLATSCAITYFGVRWLVNAMDPTHREKKAARKKAEELLRQVGVEDVKLSDYELCIAANIVDTLTINMTWDDIGGLDSVIEEIKESVILPFRERQLFSDSVLLQPPKGVLLYGPPGCGKTMLAKATAKATGAKFINLQVSSLVDKWYGESQKRAEAVFSLAMKLQPTIIFIDEIDSFLRSRSSNDHEATAMIKTQFMSFWDGLITDPKCHVMIMGATNRPKDVDAAILRRMPCMFHVGLPGKAQREKILKIIMQKEKLGDDVNFSQLAEATEEFSGSDLRETCRIAAINRIREYLVSRENSVDQSHRQAEDRQITMSDLTLAVGKMRQTKLSAIRVPMPIEAD